MIPLSSHDVMASGLCVQHHNPDAWHPHPDDTATTRIAVAICDECPAKAACLAFAQRLEGGKKTSSRFGIYGGTTPQERNAYYRSAYRARRLHHQEVI